MRTALAVMTLLMVLGLAGCGNGSKQDITKKTANVTTKAELEKALGKPDSFNKLGPIEEWKYKASDGEVVFYITGDSVATQMTVDKK